jgi:hypothetical protein
MSKTQDKRKRRAEERNDFLLARKKMQLGMFEQAFLVGKEIYEKNKEQIPANEIEQIEAQMKENQDIIDKLRAEIVELDTKPEA